MNRILVYTGIIFSLLLVLFSIFFLRNKDTGENQKAKERAPLAMEPKDKTLEKTPETAVYSFATEVKLDDTLPVFTFKKASRDQVVKLAYDMAGVLSISATPSSLLRDGVYTTTWNQFPDIFLQVSVSSNTATISFSRAKSSFKNPSVQTMSIESLLSPITSALDMQIDIETGTETEFDGLLVLDRPIPLPFQQKLVRYVKNNAVLATGEMNISAGSVITDANGVIRSATISIPLFITGVGGNVKTLSRDQILESLSEGRGRIISQGKISGKTIGKSATFTQFIIREAKIFYAPDNRLLLPALILSGDAVIGGVVAPTRIFLWNYAASR